MNLVNVAGAIDLQATLAASSAMSLAFVGAHHPITCRGDLAYHDDGTLSCEHAAAPPDDPRTRYCIDHSVALLLIELAIRA